MDHKLDIELKNEHGNPIYPKYVSDKDGNRVIVNNPEHEAEVTGVSFGKKEKEPKKKETETVPDWK